MKKHKNYTAHTCKHFGP